MECGNLKRVSNFLDRSFLSDPMKRNTENHYFYEFESCRNIANEFLKIRKEGWQLSKNLYKYQLFPEERAALFAERGVLRYGFDHGEKRTMILFLTGLGGDHMINLLEKATGKIMILDSIFKTTIEFQDEIYMDKLERFQRQIYL